eukprot:503926_1
MSYDHLIRCHKIYKNSYFKNEVSSYFRKCINNIGCIHKIEECKMVTDYIHATLENTKGPRGGIDSLYQYLHQQPIQLNIINVINKWNEIEEYDTDSIAHDINVDDSYIASNLFQEILRLTNDVTSSKDVFGLIKHHISQGTYDDDNVDDIVARNIFNSIHTYILHSSQELYRLRNNLGETNMKFSSQVNDMNTDVYEIDFGVNVLRWLNYNDKCTFSNFKEEILNNPASTISPSKYKLYEAESKNLCQTIDIDINIKEMIALKMYTDLTAFQSALRKAFWKKSSRQEKLNFYNWAITLYIAVKRYSQPIVCYDSSSSKPRPRPVYHGLNSIFAVETTLPFYNGIISTTTSPDTANVFSNNTGLLWTIRGSYSNKFTRMLGVSTDWFSYFKNECEIICFDSYIPIQKTINYAHTDADKINQLMKQLTIYKKRILKPKGFYRKIGFKFEEKWTETVLNHPGIYHKTPIQHYVVLHRLVHELKELRNTIQGIVLLSVPEFHEIYPRVFKMKINVDDKEIENEYQDGFVITTETKPFDVFFKNAGIFKHNHPLHLLTYDPCHIQHINLLSASQITLNNININGEILLSALNEETNTGGTIQIQCKNTLLLEKNGVINGNGAGRCTSELGLGISSTQDEGKSGGVIELIASEVINNGLLTCDGSYGGSGGNIKIVCNKFVNRGIIKANGNTDEYGIISINCLQYTNEGAIYPTPNIMTKSIDNVEDVKDEFIPSKSNTHKLVQNNFYHMFYNQQQYMHRYIMNDSLIINCGLQIPNWDKDKQKNGGILQIYAPGRLTITCRGHINADEAGYFGEYGMGRGEKNEEMFYSGGGYGTKGEGTSGGITYGNPKLTKLYFGSPSARGGRAGGIIELNAYKIINNGQITSNGTVGCSGGSIKIRCKVFINKGIIHAKGGQKDRNIGSGGSGRIAIFCEEFMNEQSDLNDAIHPKPYINSTTYEEVLNDNEFTEIGEFYHEFYKPMNFHQYKMKDSLIINNYLKIVKRHQNTNNNAGILQVYVPNTLKITKYAHIDADAVYDEGNDEKEAMVIDRNLTKLYFGKYTKGGGAGGIIELIAKEIINNGQITANGIFGCSGGSIKIRCKIFTNRGIIRAEGDQECGRIAIFCEEFVNDHANNDVSIHPTAYIDNETYSYDKDIEDLKFTEINSYM